MSAAELMELLRCDVSDNDTTQSGEVSDVMLDRGRLDRGGVYSKQLPYIVLPPSPPRQFRLPILLSPVPPSTM